MIGGHSGDGSILVVDDEQGILALFRFLLAPRGLRVLTAANYNEAIALAEQNRFAVGFIDMHLAGRSGLALSVRLRQLQPGMTIVMMLSYVTDNEMTDLAALPRLHKPFDIAEVLQVVDKIGAGCPGQ